VVEFSVVGKRVPMLDAPDKVTGAGLYTDDLVLPGMILCCREC
jgi:CO/xanthine dehydrogenase Mo-binding subunit